MNISDEAKWFAINEYLSSWEEGLTADEVISEVELMTDDVLIWEPFEHMDGEKVAELIMNLAENAQSLIDSIPKAQ